MRKTRQNDEQKARRVRSTNEKELLVELNVAVIEWTKSYVDEVTMSNDPIQMN